MAKIRSMINISSLKVPVELASGITVYVGPRQEIQNEDVVNLDKIRKYFKVGQDLSEPASRPIAPKPAPKVKAPKPAEAPKPAPKVEAPKPAAAPAEKKTDAGK